ncbi:biotin/lipoyl-containing protein [Desulfocastanea catecholica]
MKMFRVVVNGSEYKVGIEELAEETASPSQVAQVAQAAPAAPAVSAAPTQAPPKPTVQPAATKKDSAVAPGNVIAPMPGTVLQVLVDIGESVKKGQVLLVLEAMKMENDLMAPADGIVEKLNVTKGVSVNAGDVLVILS